MAIDVNDDVYITNLADGAGDLPLNDGFQNYTSGVAYVAELNNDASQLVFGSFYGTGGVINPTALAVDPAG